MSGFVYETAMGLQDNYLNGSGHDSALTMAQGFASDSPLKLFVVAKRQINETFGSIARYADDTIHFLNKHGQDIVAEDKVKAVTDISDMVAGIREVLARDNMKVAFFGRTSNGKSTVINGLLKNKILPSGMGHTTNCFLQVEGTDASEAYLIVEASPHDRKPVDSVSHLANALNSERLDDASLVQIFWPKNKCSLLRDDVVLVDSPGIDVSPNLDEWIDKHCLDADVFVLVSNSESTLMRTEMAFFLKVSQKLSKPNIFVLNNRWDAVAAEPENLDLVRKQHMDRSIAFLCDELNVINRDEAADRIFFVSAKEVLQTRLAEASDQQPPTFPEGAQHRYREFEQFEIKFEECLSQSAVKTKFDQHTKRGTIIVNDLKNILAQTLQVAEELRNSKMDRRKELYERLIRTQQELQLITNEIKNKICNVVDKVEYNVSSALNEEIRRLSVLINDYEKPFSSDPMVLAVYKKELHTYVEKGLGSNLRARLSTTLASCVESAQSEMIGRIFPLIPNTDYRQSFAFDSKSRQNFEVFYRFNCESLCADFQEDLEFRFSLGLLSMIKRFREKGFSDKKETSPKQIASPNPGIISASNLASEGMLLVALDRLTTTTGQSQTTIGALALGGFMVRTIGWRIIGITVGIYALLYAYERLTWTNKAKEKTFKKQYVNHATRKLKLVIDLTSANCSHQVQQELSSTFARLCRLTDETIKELNVEINSLDHEIEQLTQTSTNAVDLKSRATALLDNLARFSERYLSYR